MEGVPQIVIDAPALTALAPAANPAARGHALRTSKSIARSYTTRIWVCNSLNKRRKVEEFNIKWNRIKAEIEVYQKDIQKVILEKQRLEVITRIFPIANRFIQAELQERNEKIAHIRRHDLLEEKQQNNHSIDTRNEATTKMERDIVALKEDVEKQKGVEVTLRTQLAGTKHIKTEQEVSAGFYKKRIVELEKVIKNLEFDIVELRVSLVKHSRRSDDLKKHDNEYLMHAEQTFRDENTALQKRLRELIDANKEVTMNYQAIKKNHDLKRNEFEELVMELEEAKNACQLAIEKDIADLLTKVNDTINEYELKLERKEEQMWAMSLQMTEETTITELSAVVAELQKKQFQPRMERLKAIEKDIKGRMEEYALAEERMETGFLCPRDLQCFKIPMTLIPCGHTYCKHCVDSLREENYNVVKCQVCNTPVQNVFRNEQLESVGEQFTRRKTLTLSFLEWIKMLKVYLPDE
ncbi:hypothetical protein BCR33DRAFT_779325 [Rhizoclosmatium globosum]|uniref:RING-type domain-containing protein n=1 Tax=Rhizoclosmatium globosum TaxID=329046 RepID=A0A1Y2D122_9FUNG|nr:hypothetical protein BCR33DRAFT_779325 [Rhizoclosmatium globosum]|eukprot:ORY52950.1 hypothetical protein BCR33DRAFT_779325 [Rhizoclosmatium globosum]